MPSSVRIHFSGDLACWTRPEAKVERNSYPVPTPSAARNMLDSILWKPEFRWIVTSIELMRHPRTRTEADLALPSTLTLKRNELQSTLAPGTVSGWIKDPATYQPQSAGAGQGTDGTPRVTTALKNIAVVVEAYPLVYTPIGKDGQINTPKKYTECLERRARKGQCRSQPYFGCREFAAEFRLATEDDLPVPLDAPLGRMLYDIIFRPEGNRPVFFDAELKGGVLNTRPEQVLSDPAVREEVLACSSRR